MKTKGLAAISRHPLERPLLTLAMLVTIGCVLGMLMLSIFRVEVSVWLKRESIAAHRNTHPETASLSDEEVLKKLSSSEMGLIRYVDDLHPIYTLPIVLGSMLLGAFRGTRSKQRLQATAVEVGPAQYPSVHAHWQALAEQSGLAKAPPLFVVRDAGSVASTLIRLPSEAPFSIISFDAIEQAQDLKDERMLRFPMAQTLGQVCLGQLSWWRALLTAAAFLPGIRWLVGQPMKRAEVYGCDRFAQMLTGSDGLAALLLSTAGPRKRRNPTRLPPTRPEGLTRFMQ